MSGKTSGESLKGRYRQFELFKEAGMNDDEAAISALMSEADEIAQEMTDGGDAVRSKLLQVQAMVSFLAMRRRYEEAVLRSGQVGNGSEKDGVGG